MKELGLKIAKQKGISGFCYLNSVRTVLLVDHYEYMSLKEIQKAIIDFFIANPLKYIDVHGGCPDTVVKDVKTFFENKKFDTDIVDLIIQATGDALGVTVNIIGKALLET